MQTGKEFGKTKLPPCLSLPSLKKKQNKGRLPGLKYVLIHKYVKNGKQQKAALEMGLINIWKLCHVAPQSDIEED